MAVTSSAPPSRIERPGVSGRIAGALKSGSVLIVAGAGYGKSTAVEEAVGRLSWPVAWLRISPGHHDAGRLVLDTLDAIARALPGPGAVLQERLAESGGAVEPRTAARWIAAELESLLVDPLIMVLDDAERLDEARESLGLVAEVLRADPARLRMAVCTRRPLDLRVAKLKAAGRLVELSEGDLVFTVDEAAAVLERRSGRAPAPAEVDAVMASTLGWPLGVAITAAHPAQPVRPGGDLSAFLEEEVLAPLPAPARTMLVRAAVPDVITPPVAAALRLPDDFAARAERLGLFLSPVAGRPGAYAFHPLFREFLRGRFEVECGAGERAELLAAVGGALLSEGRRAEAVEAFLDAGRGHDALLAAATDPQALVLASPETVRAWLDRLDGDARESPLAALLLGMVEAAQGRFSAAVPALRAAVTGLGRAGIVAGEWPARFLLAECLYWAGDGLEEMAWLADGWDRPEVLQLGMFGPAVAGWAAMARACVGDYGGAGCLADGIEAAAGELAAVTRAYVAFYTGVAGGDAEVIAEDLDRARATVERGRGIRPEQIGSLPPFVFASVGAWQEAIDAMRPLQAVVDRSVEQPFMSPYTDILRAWILVHVGGLDDARRLLARLENRDLEGWPVAYAEATRAALALADGRPDDAAAHARSACAQVQPAPMIFRCLQAFTAAAVAGAAGDEPGARAIVAAAREDLDTVAPGSAGRLFRARLMALDAWLDGEDELGAAAEKLAAALAEAGPVAHHLVRAEWKRIGELAWDLIDQRLLDAAAVLAPAARAFPGGEELLRFAEHPHPDARRAIVAALAASGHPAAGPQLKALTVDPDAAVAAAASEAAGRVRAAPHPRQFTLLGGFSLRRGGYLVDDRAWQRPMAQRLVRFLLVHRGALVPEDALLEAFWPDKPHGSARSSLQVAVSRARAVLDPAGTERSSIESTSRAYRLVLEPEDRVDTDAFEAAAAAALAERSPARRRMLEHAASLWTGEPLPEDAYADWAVEWRERLVSLHRQVLAALVTLETADGRHDAAVAVARRLLATDPLDEGVHRTLMAAYARAGRRAHALRQYMECRRVLVDNLGLEPAAETVDLQRRILAGEPV